MNDAENGAIATDPGRRGNRGLSILLWTLAVTVVAGGFLALYQAVRRAQEAAIASGSQGPFNQLELALHNYHERYGCFPPAYVTDERGNRMHSWRALILPYVDANDLYQQYDFSEPWNGPNNSRLARRMPSIFHCPSEPESDRYTNAVVIVGPETAFPGAHSTSLPDFEDGLDNTILLAEISNSSIEWLEPRDLDVETMSFVVNDRTRPAIATSRRNGPYVVFADSISAYALAESMPPEVLIALTTVRGKEPLFMARVDIGGFRRLTSPKAGPATDVDLAQFKDWPHVQDIWLNRSPITDAALKHLATVPHLSKVHLAKTAITDEGLKNFKGRTYFYSLDLSGTEITDAGLPHLADLVEMNYLDLRDTHVTLPGVARLVRLLPKTEISFFSGRVSQQHLDLHGSSITNEDLEQFRGLSKMDIVDFSRTVISDSGLVLFTTMPAVRYVDLGSSRVTDDGLRILLTLSNLEDLQLTDLPITRAGLQHLARLPALRSLDLSGSQVDDSALHHLRGLSKIWRLNLARTNVTDEGLDHLSENPALIQLNLHDTHVTPAGIERLKARLPNLTITE